MNKVHLSGRLTKPIEVRFTTNNKAVVKNTIAVQRNYKNPNGEYETDFVNITLFGTTAEYLNKYTQKGSRILVGGRIQTGTYEKDGVKYYNTDVLVEDVEIIDFKSKDNKVAEENEENDPFAEFGDKVEIDDSFLD